MTRTLFRFKIRASTAPKVCGAPPYLSAVLYMKGAELLCLSVPSLNDEGLSQRGLLLKERICSYGSKFFPFRISPH